MAGSPHLQTLIAHYLAANYPGVLEPFLHAARIPAPDPAHPPQPDLRTLVADWAAHQLADDVARLGMGDGGRGAGSASAAARTPRDLLKVGMPAHVGLDGVVRSLEGLSAANLLTVQAHRVPKREFDTSTASYRASYNLSVLTSSVDKTLKIIDYASGEVDRILEPHRAAVLCFDVHPQSRYLVTGSMDGTTVLTDLITMQPLQTFRSAKFVVRTRFSPDGRWLATASYDHQIVIYEAVSGLDQDDPTEAEDDDEAMPLDESDDAALAAEPTLRFVERRRLAVDSNPESLLFHPASTWLLYTLRASHELHYQRLGDPWDTRTKSFNPHPLDTHVSFAVLDMALHPGGTLVACQTGDHRGGSGERILLYGVEPDETERLGCLWTGSEGDDFVLPRMAWLPDGTGLVTTTPNGYLKLITLAGEVRSSVKVHGAVDLGQASSEVVRDCAVVETDGGWEVVSVGYDRRVRFTR